MDIKLTKSKGFKIWLYCFIVVNVIACFIAFRLDRQSHMEYSNINIMTEDFKDTQNFKDDLGESFRFMAEYITHDWEVDYEEMETDYKGGTDDGEDIDYSEEDIDDEEDMDAGSATRLNTEAIEIIEEKRNFREGVSEHIEELNAEGQNLIYYARNPKTEVTLTNSGTDLGISEKGSLTLPSGYNFYIYYNGTRFTAEKDGKPLDIYNSDKGYRNTAFANYMGEFWNKTAPHQNIPDIRNCEIFLVVKRDPVRTPYNDSNIFMIKKEIQSIRYLYLGFILVFIIGVGLFLYAIKKREYKRELDSIISGILVKVLLEIKIIVYFIVFLSLLDIVAGYYRFNILLIPLFSILSLWLIYLIWVDLKYNRHCLFTNNAIGKIIKRYRQLEKKRPFHKAQLFRFYSLVVVEILLAIIALAAVFMAIDSWNGELILLFVLILVGIGIFLIYRYAHRYSNNLGDIGKVIDQTESIRQGDMKTRLELSPDSDLYMLEDNLNTIQEGIARAVENSVKSERMKFELITNISHDLKTPLTSIISYVDLLSKEKDLPQHVKDYIRILGQKSERLKLLIQDLFDLSKVVSGEMEFDMEILDLSKLIEQTLADLEDKITESQLTFRVNLPIGPVPIKSDGNKLYRVFLNIFQNALKYSLVGTRVYVDLEIDDERAIVIIKNTANYEMNFTEEEIVERFVRGDKARTSEGSGLGLAIAQNFTQYCGGDFNIKIDGDLFKVILSFDKIME